MVAFGSYCRRTRARAQVPACSTPVTERHYIKSGALEQVTRDRLMKHLEERVVEPVSPAQVEDVSERDLEHASRDQRANEKISDDEAVEPASRIQVEDAGEREMGNPKTVSHEERPPEAAPLGWPKYLNSQDLKECEGGDSNPHSVSH